MVIISTMVMCKGITIIIIIIIVIIEYGRRPGIYSAPVVIEHDNNRTRKSTAIALTSKHNPYIFTDSHIHIFTRTPNYHQQYRKQRLLRVIRMRNQR